MVYNTKIDDANGFSLSGHNLACNYGTTINLPVNEIVSVHGGGSVVVIEMKNGDTYSFSKVMSGLQFLIAVLLFVFVAIVGGIIYCLYVREKNEQVIDQANKNIRGLLERYNQEHKSNFYDATNAPENIKTKSMSEVEKIEAIKKWKDLLDQGVITEEEFEKNKHRIMDE